MKMTSMLLASIILIFDLASAKTITGTIVTQKNDPIEFANITAFSDDNVVAGAISDVAGVFTLDVPDDCNKLRISFPGYEDTVVSSVMEDCGTISLSRSAKVLKEVLVNAPLIYREADRIVMNVGALPLNANKDVKELLKSAPGVWADDKDLSIYGRNNVAVYIDDRRVNLNGVELMNYLKTVRATLIGTIEILPQGGAEYSADYTGGVILIKLKRNRVDGLMGSAGLNYTTGKYKQWINPLASLSLHSGKWTLNFNGSVNGCPYERSKGYSDYYKRAVSEVLNNTTDYKSRAIQANVVAGVFYDATAHDMLGFQLDYNYSDTHYSNISRTLTTGVEKDMITNGIYNHTDLFHNFNATLNWRHDLDSDGSEFKLIANYNYQSTSVNENNEMAWNNPPSDSIYTTSNNNHYNILVTDFSLKKVFNSQWTLNAGGKYTHNAVNNRSFHKSLTEMGWLKNSKFDFDEDYYENIVALYLTANGNAGRWKFKVGLRTEYYNAHSYVVKRNKWDIFPNANIGFDITENGGYNVSLGYYRNIYRPTFQSLNPIEVQTSDYYYYVGNPELTPSYTNSMSLSFILDRRFTVAMGYGATDNSIRQVITSHHDFPERIYLTWGNMGKERQAFIHADGFVNLTKWWNLYASATYSIVSQKIIDSDPFDTFGFLQLIGNTSFTLPWDVNLSVSCFYNTKRKQGNFTFSPMLFITPRIEKQFGNQWAISLGLEDMLQRMSRFKASSNGYDIVSYSKTHLAINLGITYSFSNGKVYNSKYIERNADNSRLLKTL